MKRPEEGADIEVAEERVIPAADIQVVVSGLVPGWVHLTIDAEGTDESLVIVLDPHKARALGDLLFKQGSRAVQ